MLRPQLGGFMRRMFIKKSQPGRREISQDSCLQGFSHPCPMALSSCNNSIIDEHFFTSRYISNLKTITNIKEEDRRAILPKNIRANNKQIDYRADSWPSSAMIAPRSTASKRRLGAVALRGFIITDCENCETCQL